MNAKDVMRQVIGGCQMITTAYVADLADADLLVRSVPGSNHIAWQLGHLILAERRMIGAEMPNAGYPDLPAGFAERHTKDTAAIDPPAARLLIDVTSFDVSRDSGAVIVAHWSYRGAAKDARTRGGDLSARAALARPGYDGYVEALHRASLDLAARLAAGLKP